MFALMLQGSQANSRTKFEQVIAFVRNVRDAWKQAAASPEANPAPAQVPGTPSTRRMTGLDSSYSGFDSGPGSGWDA